MPASVICRSSLTAGVALLVVLSASHSSRAQTPSPMTLDQTLARQWTTVLGKIVTIAKDFPEDKFDYKFHPDVRSFIEEIWHVTATAEWLAATLRGDEAAAKGVKFTNEGRPRMREAMVAALESAARECSQRLTEKPDPRATSVLTHAAEDYGKLVAMYRLNGLVPPASRAKTKSPASPTQ